MLRLALLAVVVLSSGCSRYEVNVPMCDDIGPHSDRALIEKCRNYNFDEAVKSNQNKKHKKDDASGDIKYEGDEEKK